MFSIDPDAKLNENEHLNNESYGEYVQVVLFFLTHCQSIFFIIFIYIFIISWFFLNNS